MSAALGIVMLDTRFPRVRGDIGNPATFAFPVRYRTVRGASPRRVVVERDPSLLAPFVAAARDLERDGASAITTSCGFLALFQRELAGSVRVPLWTSSLLLVAGIESRLAPGRRAGIVSADAASLTADHLRAVGASIDVPVEGLAPGSSLRLTLLDDLPGLDVEEASRATVDAARRLVARRPDVAEIVLECTNLPPYADAVRAATGLPVHDITTLIAARFDAAANRNPA
ncbi:MAG: aspartate/glutamate racemase family protein [Caldimonas sp.]